MPSIKLTGLSDIGLPTVLSSNDQAELDGGLTIGDGNTDSIIVNAEFDSDLIPDDHETFNLGSDTKRWNTIFARSISTTEGFPSYISFGKNYSQSAPLSNFELSTTNGSQNAQGWRMPVEGKVTHISCQFDATNPSATPNSFSLVVWKNGVEQAGYDLVLNNVQTGDAGMSREFPTPLPFAPDDRLTLKLSMTGDGFDMDDLACLLRVLS